MQKFIIIGPQGSGKGTQAQLLAEHYEFVHISIGDIFRWHVGHHTKLGARINRITTDGLLVPDEIVSTVVRERLEMHDWNFGFVLDGFPRTRPQALYLFENWNLDRAIYLDLPDEIVRDRVMHRASAGKGGGFTKRADDNPESLATRLREYHEKTRPLLELFEERQMLVTIDANRPIEAVYDSIVDRLGLKPFETDSQPPIEAEHELKPA